MTFTDAGDDDARMSAICSQALRLTRQGNPSSALKLLLAPQTWRGLNFRQYSLWAMQVWNVFDFTAGRKGQVALQREYLQPNKPPIPPILQALGPKSPFEAKSVLTESLRAAIQFKESKSPVSAIKPLTDALYSSEFRGMYGYYRVAVVLLADVCIDLDLPEMGKDMVEEVLPQILLGDDLELRAYASMTYGRCIIASSGVDLFNPILKTSRPHLVRAVKDYKSLAMSSKALDAMYTLSAVCHNLGMSTERDAWATQFWTIDESKKEIERDGGKGKEGEEMRAVFEVVVGVGNVVGRA